MNVGSAAYPVGVLPSQKRRQEEFAAREAAGESIWTNEFDKRALVRIAEVWSVVEEELDRYEESVASRVALYLRARGGWDIQRFEAASLPKQQSDELILDALACAYEAAKDMQESGAWAHEFADFCNFVMNEHRIKYRFVDGELVLLKSDVLMTEAVEPALRLLVGERYQAAHDAYLKALTEISANEAGDAITDAGTALQETLTALGCSGNKLGPLTKDAKKSGLFAGHDQTLIEGITKFMDWASADRSEHGDAYKHSDATNADAWLMVHVVGALIVRLVDPDTRGQHSE